MLKDIGKKIKRIAFIGGLGAFYVTCPIFFNNLINNREYINSNYHSITKADGALSITELNTSRDGDWRMDKVVKYSFMRPSRTMIDGGSDGKNDGLVDKIYITGSRLNGTLIREKNYEKFKDEFDKADKILAETKEKFAKYL